jgi:hypothetical protein
MALRQENKALRQENEDDLAQIARLKQQLAKEANLKVPTIIWSKLQSMALSKSNYANIVVENGVYVRLASH